MIEILIAYASSKTTGEPAYSYSLARAFVTNCTKRRDIDEGLGQIVYTKYVI